LALQLSKRQFSEFVVLILLSLFAFLVIRSSLPSLSFPYGDTWDTPVRWVISYKAHFIPDFISFLFNQHNESRKLTTNIIAFAIDPWIPGFGPFWHFLSFAIRVLTILVISIPLFKCVNKYKRISFNKNFIIAIFYFLAGFGFFVYGSGPANLWNGLWEVQTSFFLGIFFAMLALSCYAKIIFSFIVSLLDSQRMQAVSPKISTFYNRLLSIPALAIYSGIFSWLSIFSFSGNVCIAVVAVGLLIYGLFSCFRSGITATSIFRQRSFIWACFSLLMILLSVGSFFYGWTSPAHHESLRGGLNLDYIKFFLGNFYKYLIDISSSLYLISFLPIILVLVLAIYFLGNGRKCPEFVLITGSQIIFLVGLACASSIGRSGAGSEYALEPRYNSISILYWYLSFVLIYGLILTSGVSKFFKVFFASIVALGLLSGVLANLKWYKKVYSHREKLKQSEQCFKKVYLGESPTAIQTSKSPALVCSSGFYPNYELLASWFKANVCFRSELLANSKNANSVCELLDKD